MDKRTIIGIILIVIITLLMPFYQRWITGGKTPLPPKSDIQHDTTTVVKKPQKIEKAVPQTEQNIVREDTITHQSIKNVEIHESPETKTIEIETDLIHAIISSKNGGNPTLWKLKKYKHYSGGFVNLIDKNGLDVDFLNIDGKEIHLSDYNLFVDSPISNKIKLNKSNQIGEIKFYLPVGRGRIEKIIRIYPDKYSFDVIIRFTNLQNYVINRRYEIGWKNGLPPTEININDDNNYSRAYAYMAEELENIDASDEKTEQKDFNGRVDWVAIRSKYFLAAIIPSNPDRSNGASLSSIFRKKEIPPRKYFNIGIDQTFEPVPAHTDTFLVYLGPLDYFLLKKYRVDLESLVMNKDWYERLFRPISLLIIPAFKFIHRFIPNYGLVIIIFAFLIKILLHPLTKKSYQSMSEMQYLQPKLTEIREKYKNDPQRMNREMMKLYKEHGVNPMGGCLPMLLQMPLLVALFIVFRSTIQLRGQPFMLWINDLSAPDTLSIGINLPLFGNNIHVLPILMGLTMIWQSKMSITDPKQKMMAYFMPLFMIFIFYSLPSGLNLYYAVFNVLSMIQTRQIKKKMHPNNGKEVKTTTPPTTRTKVSKSKKKS